MSTTDRKDSQELAELKKKLEELCESLRGMDPRVHEPDWDDLSHYRHEGMEYMFEDVEAEFKRIFGLDIGKGKK